MDPAKLLNDLRAEREKIDRAIASLEAIFESEGKPLPSPPAERRGRKSMDQAERQQVSERMKRYWEKRRNQKLG
jgi:hypothetical protein